MNSHARIAILVLLLVGSVVNLAAGVRRPFRERAILSEGHYAVPLRVSCRINQLVE